MGLGLSLAIIELGDKAEKIAQILQRERERTRQENENKERQEREKITREQKRKERIQKAENLERRWALLRWVNEYIAENSQKWEEEWLIREEERYEEKKSRLEKIAN